MTNACKAVRRILIVDDEAGIRDALTFGLESDNGYEIFGAEGGDEALRIIEATDIDVVVSDIRMPQGNGLALLRGIRIRNRIKPLVIMMSGYADVTLQDLISMGAETLLEKPFDFDTAKVAIGRACEKIDSLRNKSWNA